MSPPEVSEASMLFQDRWLPAQPEIISATMSFPRRRHQWAPRVRGTVSCSQVGTGGVGPPADHLMRSEIVSTIIFSVCQDILMVGKQGV